MERTFDFLIIEIDEYLKSDNKNELTSRQLLAKLFTEINILLDKQIISKLPPHLQREYERLEKEFEQKRFNGDMVALLQIAVEMARIISAGLTRLKTQENAKER